MTDRLFQLTEAQKRVWITQMIYPKSTMFNIGGKAVMKGDVNPYVLERAIKRFIDLHDSLRIRICFANNAYMQYISEEEIEDIKYYDFSLCETPYKKLEALEKQCATSLFDFFESKLYDFKIFRLSKDETGYIVKLHHVIADGWSIEILSEKIQSIYSDILHGRETDGVDCLSFFSHVEEESVYLNSSIYGRNKAFWKGILSPLPKLPYFEDESTAATRKQYMLPKEISKKIRAYVKKTYISLNCFFIMSYLIYRYITKNETNIIVGIPVMGRSGRKERKIFGMFTNTLPFRFVIDVNESCDNMRKRVFSLFKKCITHQKYPYNHLINDLNLMSFENCRLFECCINYYNTSLTRSYEDLSITNTEFFNGEQEYPMQLIIREWGQEDDIQIDIDYKTTLYSNAQVDKFYHDLLSIFNEICTNSDKMINQLKDINKNYDIMRHFNEMPIRIVYKDTIVHLINCASATYYNRIALEDCENRITYGEFVKRGNSFACFLQGHGIRSGDIVTICAEYSIDMLIAILGILKAGAAYLPLDPDIPIKRLQYILQDAKAALLITNIDLDLEDIHTKSLDLRKNTEILQCMDTKIDESQLDTPAYIIYTSGSTGMPKGVVVYHRSLSNYIMFAKRQYKVVPEDVFPLYSSIAFDLTVSTLFTPLVAGAKIKIYNKNRYDDFILYEILRENMATIIKLTPSHLKLVLGYESTHLKITRYIVGGEDFPTYLAAQMTEKYGGDISLYNEYGPTEATVGCMIHEYKEDEDKQSSVPIGIPIDNTRIYLLNDTLIPVDIGEVGEIYVGGEALSKGYLNRQDITKKSFLPDIMDSSRYMYKTGDLAKFITKHRMIYLGRIDNQVKINGNRIELQEILSLLQSVESIDEVYIEKYIAPNKSQCLCVYYKSDIKIKETELKNFLSEQLPSYMIPSRFVRVKEIPLTKNGKIDKDRIESFICEDEIGKEEGIRYAYRLPEDSIEEIRGMIRLVLETEEIRDSDNFYALGGDSIKAIQLVSRLKGKDYSIPIKKILSAVTIGEMIQNVAKNDFLSEGSPKACVGLVGKTPITEWFFQRDYMEPGFYNQSCILHISQPVTESQVKDAFIHVIRHHDSLRISVNTLDKSLFYKELDEEAININSYYLEKELSKEAMEARLHTIYNENSYGFDLEKDLLIRAVYIRCNDNAHKVMFIAHRFVVDSVSWRIIVEEFIFQLEGKQALPENASYQQWSDTIALHKSIFFQDLEYWRQTEQYLSLNRDFIEGNAMFEQYKNTEKILFNLEMDISKDLVPVLKNAYNITVEEFVICCITSAICSTFGRERFLIEIEKHGRNLSMGDVDISRTVGWFTSIFPLFIHIHDNKIHELILSVKESCRTIPSAGMSYGVLKYIFHVLSGQEHPLFRINYLGSMGNGFDNKNYRLEYDTTLPLVSGANCFDYLLDIISFEKDNRLYFNLVYCDDYVAQDDISMFIQEIKRIGNKIYDHCKNQKDTYYTPSDFDFIRLTQKELDSLFEEVF